MADHSSGGPDPKLQGPHSPLRDARPRKDPLPQARLFLVDFAPAAGRDDDSHNRSQHRPRHRTSRRNRAIWDYLQLPRPGSGGEANPESDARSGRKADQRVPLAMTWFLDRKSTRLNSSHLVISYAVFCLKTKE